MSFASLLETLRNIEIFGFQGFHRCRSQGYCYRRLGYGRVNLVTTKTSITYCIIGLNPYCKLISCNYQLDLPFAERTSKKKKQ